MGRPNPKRSHVSEFAPVLRGWDTPVLLENEAIPSRLRGMPEGLCHSFIASGELVAPQAYESPRFGATERIAGLYVVRYSPVGPEPFDRDDYSAVRWRRDPEVLWLDGPYKHPAEHHASADDVERLLSLIQL